MTHSLEQNQALLDGFIGLMDDLLEDECDVRTVDIILQRLEALLAVEKSCRPEVRGTQRVLLANIKKLWEESKVDAGDAIPEAIERIIFTETPRYGSGW